MFVCHWSPFKHVLLFWRRPHSEVVRFLVECGENDRCELKGMICPATFLCSRELDCEMLKVFNGLFTAIVSLPRGVVMHRLWHVINHAVITWSDWKKLLLLPWILAAHWFLIGQHGSGWSTVMLGFMGVHEWAWWLINYNYQRPDNSPEMIITSSVLYCSGGKSISGV